MRNIASCINESLTDSQKMSSSSKKKMFNDMEKRFIDVFVGDTWYVVPKDNEDYDRIDFIVHDMKPTAILNQDKTGHQFKGYMDEAKHINIVLMLDYKTKKPIQYIVAPNTIR